MSKRNVKLAIIVVLATLLSAGGYAVDVAGSRRPVRLSARSPHDPANSHIHS